MREAILEAKRGMGWTSPNPIVGALIVRKGHIIGRGFHRKAGCAHAEIEALRSLKSFETARGAELFVTLEPCSTQGRTPPCTDTLVHTGLARVIYGATDPNPQHAGRANAILRRAGIEVTTGVLEEECLLLNEGWNKWIRTQMPFVIAKAAMTLDGRIASHPKRRWITSVASRKNAMILRASVDAILIGGETVRVDNPRLTLRGVPARPQPWRVVWTHKRPLPANAKIFTDRYRDRTLVFQGKSLKEILHSLGTRGVSSVLIEGGGTVLGMALDQGLIDKFCFYYAPTCLGGNVPAIGGIGVPSPEQALHLVRATYTRLGEDLRLDAYPQYPLSS